MPQTIDRKEAKYSKTRRRWFIPGLIGLFLVLLIIIVATIVIFGRRQPMVAQKLPAEVLEKPNENPKSSLEKSNIFKAKIPTGATNPTESPTKIAKLAKTQMKPASPAGNLKEKVVEGPSAMANVTVDPQKSKSSSAVRNPQPGKAATLKRPLQKRPASKTTTASKKTISGKSVPSGKPASKAKKPVTTRKYDRMDDSKLKLQALAWFSDASKRMAVINSHIVREGGSVDGYQVTQIRRQDVVVSDGRKSWRLVFGLKQ
jgi:cytoskeletal protein RodZ